MISRDEIANCYRFLLGREASKGELDAWFSKYKNISRSDLIAMFKGSEEFKNSSLKYLIHDDLYKEMMRDFSMSEIIKYDKMTHFLRDSYMLKVELGKQNRDSYEISKLCARLAEFENPINCPCYFLQDTGIVLQGPVMKQMNFTQKIASIYRKIYPRTPIVISTWKGEADQNFRDVCRRNHIVVLENELPSNPGFGHVNYQIKSSYEGLKYLEKYTNVKFALKSRTDQWFSRSDFLVYLHSLLQIYPPTGNRQSSRIVMQMGIGFPLNFVDYYSFGSISDMCKLYGIPYVENEDMYLYRHFKRFKDISRYFQIIQDRMYKNSFHDLIDFEFQWDRHSRFLYKFLCPEIYITRTFYSRYIEQISQENLISSWINFLKNYIVIPETLSIYWPKYERYRLMFVHETNEQQRRWIELLSICSSDINRRDTEKRVLGREDNIQKTSSVTSMCSQQDTARLFIKQILRSKRSAEDFQREMESIEGDFVKIIQQNSFLFSAVELIKTGKSRFRESDLSILENFTLVLEILTNRRILKDNEAYLRKLCNGNNFWSILLELFLRITKDDRVLFLSLKNEEEIWMQFAPICSSERKEMFSVGKNVDGSTWPWVNEINDSSFAGCLKPSDDGINLSVEFCSMNRSIDSQINLKFPRNQHTNICGDVDVVKLYEEELTFSDHEVPVAVNKLIDQFCNTGDWMLGVWNEAGIGEI